MIHSFNVYLLTCSLFQSFTHLFIRSCIQLLIQSLWVVAPGEGLDYKAMGSIFSGLVQCGAWGCFDEFNRIEAEVLSVVSSQIRQIQEALKNGLTRFPFEGILHACLILS